MKIITSYANLFFVDFCDASCQEHHGKISYTLQTALPSRECDILAQFRRYRHLSQLLHRRNALCDPRLTQ